MTIETIGTDTSSEVFSRHFGSCMRLVNNKKVFRKENPLGVGSQTSGTKESEEQTVVYDDHLGFTHFSPSFLVVAGVWVAVLSITG